jgi:hypothetical protein
VLPSLALLAGGLRQVSYLVAMPFHGAVPDPHHASVAVDVRRCSAEALLSDVVDLVLRGIAAPPSGGQNEVSAAQ